MKYRVDAVDLDRTVHQRTHPVMLPTATIVEVSTCFSIFL